MSHGCYNRAPLQEAIVVYGMDSQTGETIRVVIPHQMTTECQYQKFDRYADPGCVDCVHKKESP